MIKGILEMLRMDDWYVGDNDIDIAKGINEAPTAWKEIKPWVKRNNYKLNG